MLTADAGVQWSNFEERADIAERRKSFCSFASSPRTVTCSDIGLRRECRDSAFSSRRFTWLVSSVTLDCKTSAFAFKSWRNDICGQWYQYGWMQFWITSFGASCVWHACCCAPAAMCLSAPDCLLRRVRVWCWSIVARLQISATHGRHGYKRIQSKKSVYLIHKSI